MPSVVFYISGHGFGHATRQIEIINALGAHAPDLRIVVRSSASPWILDRALRARAEIVPGECDTGAVQVDSVTLDERETIRRAAIFTAGLPEKAKAEAELLRARDARFVLVDAAPLGCAAAAAAGVPSVVISNFTWDWIYEGYGTLLDEAPDLVPAIQNAYRQSEAAWRLPLAGGFATFDPAQIVDVPFVARRASRDRDDVRRTLGLPLDRPIVLFSFGGLGVRPIDFSRVDALDRYDLLLTNREWPGRASTRHVHVLPERSLDDARLRYEDLVAASDVVLSKPGYGIISECVANGSALLYTSRGRFAEYDVLVSKMPRFVRCGFIDHPRLFEGRWRAALDAVLAQPAPPERAATDGAAAIARMILSRLARL